ncbi:hypothetical protein BDZ90DRAFT_269723 [Jaminaea rosea]|uniref:Nnf1-domain-containing protein n=1 Tax=Jaminaea rosea TaxID=1569628 RepID=A0A316UYE7_9BASI|nr:hypothetical protein BDZ90DRAFT_269723 [Jaminaea rosea]PWN29808.1 hypothetical protein BDZ90DRAFT_269723 [Jaminaea rosea]
MSPARPLPPQSTHAHATDEDEEMVRGALQQDEEGAEQGGEQIEAETIKRPRTSGTASGSSSRRQSRASMPRKSGAASSSRASGIGAGPSEDVRLRKLDEALDRFLGLVDVRATQANFSAALPQLDAATLEPARQALVSSLKDTIKREQASLVGEYELEDRLRELQRLAVEADQRAERGLELESEEMKDVWRADLDISTALHARAIPAQRERVAKLEAELAEIEESNTLLHSQLTANINEADEKQADVRGFLDMLERAVSELKPPVGLEKELRGNLEALAAELGPRA